MQGLRAKYGVHFAGATIINNANSSGQELFDFGFVSGLMFSLDAFGSSDTSYGSSSAAVKFWDRPEVASLGILYNLNGSVQVDQNNAYVYHRYIQRAKLSLGFATGAHYSEVDRIQASVNGPQGATGVGLQGPQGFQGSGGLGLQGPQGFQGTGLQGIAGVQGPQGGSSPAAGECYLSNNSTETSIAASNTWYDVSGTWAAGELSSFTHSGGVLTAQVAGRFRVVASISAKAAGQNKDIEFGVSINNADPIAKAVMPRVLSTDFGAIPLSCVVNISATDTIRLKVRNTGDTTNATVGYCNLSIIE